MKYALDFSLVGKTVSGVNWNGTEEGERFSLTSLQERLGFVNSLQSGDSIFLAAGGLSGEVAKRAARQGANVYLVAGSKFREATEKSESVALALKRLGQADIALFNLWLPEEADILELTISLYDWLKVMEQRKAVANQIRQDFYQAVLRDPSKFGSLSVAAVQHPSQKLLEKADKGKVSDIDILQALADERIANTPHYKWLSEREEVLEQELKRAVLALPLYQKVFADLNGCGPLISARVIAFVRRIDRFPGWAHLASYAGFGLKDGKKQRRTKGESLGYNPQLKSAIQFLWIRGQLIQWKRGEWAERLSERIAYEVDRKGTGPGTPTGRAIWWFGKKICRILYYRWKAFERGEEVT